MTQSITVLKQIQVALAQGDYKRMRELLLRWQKVEPKNPWFRLYVARWYEETHCVEQAEKGYRQLLKGVTIPKVVGQARQGLARLEALALEKEQQAIATEKASPDDTCEGLLILEPITPEQRKQAAQHFASVFKTDPYSATLQLPLKSWRLFRTGQLGELRFQAKALAQGQIPSFCLPLAPLQNIPVIHVETIEQLTPHLNLQGFDGEQQPCQLQVPWEEITQWVTGILPLFEESLEKDGRGKPYYKTKILDYAQFCDLHWGDRQLILRFNDQQYQFQKGFSFLVNQGNLIENFSNRRNWNNMQAQIAANLTHARQYADFKAFANTAQNFPELLRKISPHIHLFRQEIHKNNHWDPAWHLYSTIILAQTSQKRSTAIASKN